MEVNTGRLMTLADRLDTPAGVERLPAQLQRLARMRMWMDGGAGREAVVSDHSQHPLSKWRRDRLKEKRKAKIAAASRRRNRHGKR